MDAMPKLEPLKVRCSDANCTAGLHCFSPNKRKKNWQASYQGSCRACGINLIPWDRVKRRDLTDVAGTFAALERELIRHVFFHADFDEDAIEQARLLGRDGLRMAARPHLVRRIEDPARIFRDGTQTPKMGSALNFAQHATATCCRKCLDYWHGIAPTGVLTKAELDYCEGLVLAYLDRREPELLSAPPILAILGLDAQAAAS